ncbi:uncharacterized protein PITG_19845 [Phytophthora infestans T30-4]|uniref:Uncharacterized protein n=1 Tax=Phytophthora infestans (strain T30-4) TaxID=403677 RepID=D0P0W3_PHYIT|nr:uncharacterized protein PITG_19845 [Phytophthora infestans T30-4]EEY53670.1 hypothetical protein PITG_19845 [Phytophthora infestans T30-4]|eukprot:XP_002896056.1 hypothetical protein PITG_19845 [Phytophthora infestans T30-4]
MVLLRSRRNKLGTGLRPGDNDDGSNVRNQAQTREIRRRGALYNVSSSNGRRLPSVSLQPADARVRRDLLRLTQLEDKRVESEKKSVYEDEQNDCKHREYLNYRPPMDQIHKLRDLHTTVAKDCRERVINRNSGSNQEDNTKAEWRLGYSNSVDTGSRAGVGGTFEPRDKTRERILDWRSAAALLPDSVVVAYPLNNPRRRVVKKKPWCPASSSKSPSSVNSRRRYPVERFTFFGVEENGDTDFNDHDGLQRFPIRRVESFESTEETETEGVVDPRCADRQQSLCTKAAETFSRVRARIDRFKEPHLRYELPVEDPVQYPRSYRLGLDDVLSTASVKMIRNEKPHFRPKSAGASVGFQTKSQAQKPDDLLAPGFNESGKVAGARRRPHSASITFFTNSTVYCMGPATPSKSGCISAASDFRSVVDRMTLDEYMSTCGCLNSTTISMQTETSGSSLLKEAKRFLKNTEISDSGGFSSVDTSPSLITTRKTLVVSRQQFHLALEPFNLSSTDVNLLYSALDLTVSDVVQVWDVICTVEMLQIEHTAIRRARVQQLQAPPAKDLEFFRRIIK